MGVRPGHTLHRAALAASGEARALPPLGQSASFQSTGGCAKSTGRYALNPQVNPPGQRPLDKHVPTAMAKSPDDIYAVDDREAKDDAERRESRVLYEALRARKDQIDGINQIPAKNDKLSEQILGEARKRSAEISGVARQPSPSQAIQIATRPIPWWLWLAWVVAIAGAIAAFKFLG